MSIYWNFRKILAIDPKENRCVGFAYSKGRRCNNPLHAHNRERADRLLDKMDMRRMVLPEKFEQLADAMLCLGMHNCKTNPSKNQVDEVCEDWQGIFKDHVKKLKRKQSTRKALRVKLVRDGLQADKVPATKIEPMTNVCLPRFCCYMRLIVNLLDAIDQGSKYRN